MAALQLRLLGGFEARLASGKAVTFPRKKAQALFAYLALLADQVHPRDKLATLLWGDVPDDRARHSLRQALLTIRHAVAGAAGCVVEQGDGVALAPAHVDVDVTVFERLAAQTTGEALEQAAGLYRGDLLEGVRIAEGPFEDWLRTERARLRELAVEVLARLLGHQDRNGAVDHAVRTAIRLLGLDPVQESVHRALMRLHVRQDRPAAALQQYQDCVDVLERELGATPEAETRRLYQEVLRTLSRAPVAVSRPTPPVPPVSAAPFELPAPGAPLVGRDTEIGRLRRALQDAWQGQGAAALIGGEAGIGKTRLVETLIAEALAVGGQVLLGRAHENEQVLPLGPWIEAFRSGQAIASLEALEVPWRAELGRLFPELGAPHRTPTAAEDYVRLFEAVARAVDHLALTRPLLLVLEDLQIASWELALEAHGRLPASRAGAERAIDLRFELRHSCVPLADHTRILVHLQEAEAAARAIADSTRLGWTLAYRTHGLYLAGDSRAAAETGERARALAIELDDAVLEEWANVYVAQVYHWIGRYRDGIDRLHRNRGPLEARLARRGVASRQFVNTRMFLAWCLAEVGEFGEAHARAEEAIGAARASDSAYWLVHAYGGAALADVRRGALDEAVAGATRALDLCRGRDYFVLWAIPATILGAATALAGRPTEGIRLLERAVDITGVLAAPVLVFLGQAYLAAERTADGRAAARRALALAVANGERGWEAWGRFLLAEVTAREGAADAALAAYRDALALAQVLDMQPLVAHCHRGLGTVHRSQSKHVAADEHETMAAALYRRMDMRPWLDRP